MMRLHDLTPEQIEEWQQARLDAGRAKYGDSHMQRYGLVDVMEELLDAHNILALMDDRMGKQVDALTVFMVHTHIRKTREALSEAAMQLLKADKLLPDHVCSDEQGGERIWWSEQVRRDDEVCMCGGLIEDHTGYEGHTPVSMSAYYEQVRRDDARD